MSRLREECEMTALHLFTHLAGGVTSARLAAVAASSLFVFGATGSAVTAADNPRVASADSAGSTAARLVASG